MLEVEKVGLAYFIRGGVMALSWKRNAAPLSPVRDPRVTLVGVRLINLPPSSSRERADRLVRGSNENRDSGFESLVHSLFLSLPLPLPRLPSN